MKKLILVVSLFAIAACSSKPKEDEAALIDPPAASADTAPSAEPAAEPPAEPSAKIQNTADSGASMDGGFPDVEGTERSGATCKNGGDERLVSVIDTREGPCGVVYTKNGAKKTVAYAKFDMGFCDKVYSNITGNLSNGGFDCGGAGAAPAPKAEEAPAAEEAKPAGK